MASTSNRPSVSQNVGSPSAARAPAFWGASAATACADASRLGQHVLHRPLVPLALARQRAEAERARWLLQDDGVVSVGVDERDLDPLLPAR